MLELTSEQTPQRPDEALRIQQSGGAIFNQRIEGELAVTRAIGNQHLKNSGIIAEPEIANVQICQQDQFLVLATDGIFTVMSKEETVA